jgi:hypothetical protein
MITALREENPALFQAYEEALTDAEAVSAFLRHSGRFPLTARGDINTYPLFAELGRSLLRGAGRLGLILPTGIATDDSNKHFFATVVDKRQLVALLDFENREGLFPAIDSRMKFSVFILRGRGAPDPAKLLFFATRAEQAEDPNRPFALSAEDFARLNPNTRTCPVFRTRHDADLTRAIYQRIPILWRENPEENPWRIRFARLFHMANDSHLFRTGAELEAQGFTRVANRYERGSTAYLPLYEGKLLWHYDHRYATFAGGDSREVSPAEHARPDFLIRPRYWVPATEVEKRLADQTWERRWLVGFRNITNTTNERTVVAGLIPYAGVGHSAPLLLAHRPGPQILALIANLTSLVLDYVARQKVGGTTSPSTISSSFPCCRPTGTRRRTYTSSSRGCWSWCTRRGIWLPSPRMCGRRRTRPCVLLSRRGSPVPPAIPIRRLRGWRGRIPSRPSCGMRRGGPSSGPSWMPTTPTSTALPASSSATSSTPTTSRPANCGISSTPTRR